MGSANSLDNDPLDLNKQDLNVSRNPEMKKIKRLSQSIDLSD